MTEDLASSPAAGQTSNGLPREYIALIEHMELNEAGWWVFGIQRLVLAALWMQGPTNEDQLSGVIGQLTGLDLDQQAIGGAVAELRSSNLLFDFPDGRLKLSEEAKRLLDAELARVDEADRRAEALFTESLERHAVAVEAEKCWEVFNNRILTQLIKDLGARVYELLSGTPGELLDASQDLDKVIADLAPTSAEQLRQAFAEFLDPGNGDVRSYVLRRLNAYFFLEAARLPRETLDALDTHHDVRRELRVFVDTNFLFSILGLHENPSNEAALALQSLIRQVANRIDVKLYVLPITVDETRRVLRNHATNLQGLAIPSNLARVPFIQVSGLTRRYLEEASKSPTRLSADEFFGAYETDLLTVLRSKGVELYNEAIDDLRMDQDVIDDLHDQEDFQRNHRVNGAKPYEANLHDMVVWHFTSRRRPQRAESPLDERFWIVTVDFGFLSFDKHKWRKRGSAHPLCLHPATLTQFLQFWVPRDEVFEEALLGAFRLPFLQVEFDPRAEEVTLKILRKLSRYKDIDDLQPKTVGAILENQALRSRLARPHSESEADEFIEEALVSEVHTLEQQLSEHEARLTEVESRSKSDEAAFKAKLEARERDLAERSSEAEKLKSELAAYRSDLNQERDRVEAAYSEVEELRQRLSSLEEVLDEERLSARRRRARSRFAFLALGLIVVAALVSFFASQWIADSVGWPTWVVYSGIGVGVGALYLLALERAGSRSAELADWPLLTALGKLRIALITVAGTVTLSVLASFVYEAVR